MSDTVAVVHAEYLLRSAPVAVPVAVQYDIVKRTGSFGGTHGSGVEIGAYGGVYLAGSPYHVTVEV